MSLGWLAFANPWLLAALATLPILYWLLRTVPPRPRQIEFPPTRILVGLENREKTPAKTPWWLLLIRLLAATLVIMALAEPILNPTHDGALKGNGPVVIAVDNGWASAPRWAERMRMVERTVAEAQSRGRPVVVLPTASPAKVRSVRIEAPQDARATIAALQPQPFAPDRAGALSALQTALAEGKAGDPSVVWLTDGIDHKKEARAFADGLAAVAANGSFVVIEDTRGTEALGLHAGVGAHGKLEASIVRAEGGARDGTAYALSARGQRLGETPFRFASGETTTDVAFDLPLELRNQVARVEIANEPSAGAVSLLDARSQWKRIGLISGENREQAQPLLAPVYYIQKALAPFSEIVQPKDANLAAGVDWVLKQNANVLVMADIGTLSGAVKEQVENWVEKGGVLVRFAGPRLEKGGDDMLPVPLRLGGRTLGGALSWSTPQPLAPFDDQSLFAGLNAPADVTINRQVLADPSRLGSDVSVWARLKDGTPLVTAARRGDGQIVLFHITANSDWSNLPMSGLFVEMLQRIATLGSAAPVSTDGGTAESGEARTNNTDSSQVLAPLQTLDGFGVLKQPPPTAQSLPAAKVQEQVPDIDHPPGYYGPQGSPRAINVMRAKATLAPLPGLPSAAEQRGYESEAATPLKPWLLALALGLIFADIIAVLFIQFGGLGLGLGGRRPAGAAMRAAAVLLAVGVVMAATPLLAQSLPNRTPQAPLSNDAIAQRATSKVTLGYVLTGEATTDQTSRQGLAGLCKVLALRTAVEPGDPIGIDIERDEIAFYPLLYWPVVDKPRALSPDTLAKIDAYMKQGGLIIFDTRDFGQGIPNGLSLDPGEGTALKRLIGQLDIPRLEPVPEGHVLTKSFYLIRTFPGRWDGGELWVEAGEEDEASSGTSDRKARHADGVTSIIVTANDFASAWALDDRGRPIYPTVPGGEAQREAAFRTGVNIVMHALTGNYKADQVHVPALLERLGQ